MPSAVGRENNGSTVDCLTTCLKDIYQHLRGKTYIILQDNVKIVKVCRSLTELRISEAVQIRLTSLSLCIQTEFVYDCSLIP